MAVSASGTETLSVTVNACNFIVAVVRACVITIMLYRLCCHNRTADQTMIGTIAKLSSGEKKGETTMKIEVQRFVKFIAIQSAIMAVILAIIGFSTGQPVASVLINAFVGIFVANIPQGLPATVTSLLSLTCASLAKQQVYVKQNEIIEALGSASVICSDKTGTLTQNRMRYGTWASP